MSAYASELKNGAAATYTYSFDVISTDYVKVALQNSETGEYEDIPKTHGTYPWTIDGATKEITMTGTQFPSGTGTVRITRDTPLTDIPINFNAGSALTAAQLNENFRQTFDAAQEVKVTYLNSESSSFDSTVNLNNNNIIKSGNIIFEGSTDDEFETTLTVTDPTADRTITLPNVTGTVVTTGDTGTVTSTMINDGTIVDDDISATADITPSKVNHGTARQVLQTNASGDTTEWTSDISVGALGASGNVTFTGTTDNTLGNENSGIVQIDGGVGIAKNLTVKADLDVDGTTNLDAVDVDGDVDFAGDVTFSAAKDVQIKDNEAAALEIAEGTNNYVVFVTTNDGEKIETHQTLNIEEGWQIDTTAVTATATEINQLDDKTLDATIDAANWIANDPEKKFPSASAVESRINAKIGPLGGFEAISTINDFPETIPDSGVIISIADADGLVINGSGTSTTADSITSDQEITINGFPSTMNSTTVQDGLGLMVVSTGADQTYNFHRVIATDADVIQLSDDINDFNNRYRPAAASDYTTDNNVGDTYFNTTSNRLRICTDASGDGTYVNGVATAAGDVAFTAGGDIAATTVQAAIDELDDEKVPRTSTTGSATVPSGSTEQRDAIPEGGTAADLAGFLRFNSTNNQFEGHNGTAWGAIGGGATGGGSDQVFIQNGNQVTEDHEIPENTNAGSFGPITIDDGVTVEIPATSNWTIV